MTTQQTRLELLIDIFDKKAQRAQALATLTPLELIAAVLQEFREIEYLSNMPTDYRLLKADDRTELNPETALNQQVRDKEQLMLFEQVLGLPKNSQRPTRPVYLREQATSKVYKLHWYPAIIGRPDTNKQDNDWLAVNLGSYSVASHVSRRHAQLTEENGHFYITSLSEQNPTSVKDVQGNTTTLTTEKHRLQHGDIISLDYSQIALKFLVREKPGSSQPG